MNLPNKLTIFRIILVPIMVIIPFFNIDGEMFNIPITWLLIDPIADKILVLAAMIMLVEATKLPAWIPIIVLFREFIVSGYRLIAVEKSGNVIAASIWGKLKTVTQMLGLIIALIDVNSFGKFLDGSLSGINLIINIASTTMLVISVIATIFSGWEYIKDGKDLLLDK